MEHCNSVCRYITSAAKYGVDYLLYPGDPAQYHATHLVLVLSFPRKNWSSLLDVAGGSQRRQATNTQCSVA